MVADALPGLLLAAVVVVAWLGIVALAGVAVRTVTGRLRAADIETDTTENVHCGTVLGLEDDADDDADPDRDYLTAETVLCPECGTRNRREFHRCKECVSPMRPGGVAAD
jgi:hypothetical protein